MPTSILKMFGEYGGLVGIVLGVVILGMGVALKMLWARIGAKDKELDKERDRYTTLQEERHKEAQEHLKASFTLSEGLRATISETNKLVAALSPMIQSQSGEMKVGFAALQGALASLKETVGLLATMRTRDPRE